MQAGIGDLSAQHGGGTIVCVLPVACRLLTHRWSEAPGSPGPLAPTQAPGKPAAPSGGTPAHTHTCLTLTPACTHTLTHLPTLAQLPALTQLPVLTAFLSYPPGHTGPATATASPTATWSARCRRERSEASTRPCRRQPCGSWASRAGFEAPLPGRGTPGAPGLLSEGEKDPVCGLRHPSSCNKRVGSRTLRK